MNDVVEGLLWLLLLPVTCFVTFAVVLALSLIHISEPTRPY